MKVRDAVALPEVVRTGHRVNSSAGRLHREDVGLSEQNLSSRGAAVR